MSRRHRGLQYAPGRFDPTELLWAVGSGIVSMLVVLVLFTRFA